MIEKGQGWGIAQVFLDESDTIRRCRDDINRAERTIDQAKRRLDEARKGLISLLGFEDRKLVTFGDRVVEVTRTECTVIAAVEGPRPPAPQPAEASR